MDTSRFDGPLARHLRKIFQRTPDPWPEEITASVNAKTAIPLCTNCTFPQGPHSWFCPNCGFPTGDYVVLMPYLQNFVIGEVLRRGVSGAPERRRGVQWFLAIYATVQYTIFAPVYWYWMARRAAGRPICPDPKIEIQVDDDLPTNFRPE